MKKYLHIVAFLFTGCITGKSQVSFLKKLSCKWSISAVVVILLLSSCAFPDPTSKNREHEQTSSTSVSPPITSITPITGETKRDTVENTTKDDGKTWTPPATAQKNTKNESPNTDLSHDNPDPIQPIIHHDAQHMQMHLFDHSDSVWIDGDWRDNKTNLFGPRYVSTYVNTSVNPPKSVIEELDLNASGQGYTDHVCPKPIGHITIAAIDTEGPKKWMLIHFKSSSGVKGTLDLSKDQWTFHTN